MSTELQLVDLGVPSASPTPVFASEKLERLLDVAGGDVDPYWRLAAAFLVGHPPHSSRAYYGDLKAWYASCALSGVHPLTARRHHVDAWIRQLSGEPQPATGRPASIARRLSCLSKFYDYGITDVELLEHSPVANVRRPKVSDDSPTIGLTAEELGRLLTAAEAHSTRAAALVSLLVYSGLRIAEVLACDVERAGRPNPAGVMLDLAGMEQIKPWSDERLAGVCPYCGGQSDTREHVPSRALLDRPYPENLPTVPACRPCNQGFSLDEEYVAALLEFAVNGADGAQARPSVSRSLDRSGALESRLFGSLRADGDRVWIAPEGERVDRIIVKLARGHAMHELSELRPEAPAAVAWAALETLSEETRSAFEAPVASELLPEIGSRAFTRLVRSLAQPAGGGIASPWSIVQPGRYRFLAAALDADLVVRIVVREYLAAEVSWADTE